MERVLGEMMADRGYTLKQSIAVPDAAAPNLRQYAAADGADVWMFLYTKASDSKEVSVKEARAIKKHLDAHASRHAIVVCASGMNNYASREAATYDVLIECFEHRSLHVNPTKSCYYCPHRKLAREEARAVMRKYGKENLWHLWYRDAVARYFGFQPGDVVAVKLDYGGFEDTEVFRLVVREAPKGMRATAAR